MSGPSVVVAGGGTAGHIEPALNLVEALVRLDPRARVLALGTQRGLETRLVPARGVELALIPPVPLPRRPTADLLAVPGRLAGAVRAAGRVLDRAGADILVGFGGYVALPGYLAARWRRLPILVHEANARPGLANRVGARLTPHVATAVAGSGLPGARVVGLPLRPAIANLDRAAERKAARAELGLDADAPTLLVVGGSQGARSLNTAVAAAAPGLAAAGVQVLHATGPAHLDAVRGALPVVGSVPYRSIAFVERMDRAYAAADLALCRAGAMTVAETSAVGLPAAFVPLPIGNGEQAQNAAPVVRAGGGLLVDDAELSPAWIEATLVPLLCDEGRLQAMAVVAAACGHRDAGDELARWVLELARRAQPAVVGT